MEVPDGADGDAAIQAGPGVWQALKSALLARLVRRTPEPDAATQAEVSRLTTELDASRAQLRLLLQDHENVTSQLRAFGEEMLSSNEEFQSTNEELETTKEELQSLNEELSTTNEELRYRHRELKVVHGQAARARDYADALIETLSQPMMVLDAELRVVRANHAYYSVFKAEAGSTLHARFYDLGSGQWDTPPVRELIDEQLPAQAPRSISIRPSSATTSWLAEATAPVGR